MRSGRKDKMKSGTITLYWEIKEEGRIAVGVEMPPETRRLPLVFRRHIVIRLRQMLIPGKNEAMPQ